MSEKNRIFAPVITYHITLYTLSKAWLLKQMG